MICAKKAILVLFFFVLVLICCDNPDRQANLKSETGTIVVHIDSTGQKSTVNDTVNDNYQVFIEEYDDSTTAFATGIFYNRKDFKEAIGSKEKWFGLFKNERDYYLAQTKITMKNIEDTLTNAGNEKKVFEVGAVNKDTCLILIKTSSNLTGRKIQKANLSKKYIYPGDTLIFEYLGIEYKILAMGYKREMHGNPGSFYVSNYKLYILANIKGERRESLLFDKYEFVNEMISLFFLGDLDGDGILDIIIDTNEQKNVLHLLLYLSHSAGHGRLVEQTGMRKQPGC